MNIPNLPHPTVPLVSNGQQMHPQWYTFFTQLIKECQTNLSEEGLNIPQQTKSNISTLQAASPLPSFIYDKEDSVVKVAINGTYKTVTTS